MGSTLPRSVRFDAQVNARLSAYVTRHPGSSGSSVANQFVDEALRMDEHPGVVFRDGRTGRRAVLVGGPDVREVIRAVKSARASEPDLTAGEIVALVDANTGVPARLADVAVRYWSSDPAEIDAWISEVEAVEAEALTGAGFARPVSSAAGSRPGAALLLDEMLSRAIAERLRQQGLEAVAVVEDPR